MELPQFLDAVKMFTKKALFPNIDFSRDVGGNQAQSRYEELSEDTHDHLIDITSAQSCRIFQ